MDGVTDLLIPFNTELKDVQSNIRDVQRQYGELVSGVTAIESDSAAKLELLDANIREREIAVGRREELNDVRERSLGERERNLEKRQELLERLRGECSESELIIDELYRRYLDGELERDIYSYVENNFEKEDNN